MVIAVVIAIAVPLLMYIAWLVHIAVVWNWNFEEWRHSCDEDI